MNFDNSQPLQTLQTLQTLQPLQPLQTLQPPRRSNRLKERALKIQNEGADAYFKSLKDSHQENKDLMTEVVYGPLPLLRMLACPSPNIDWGNMLLRFKRIIKPLSPDQKRYYDIFLLKCYNISDQKMPEDIRREYCKILMKET